MRTTRSTRQQVPPAQPQRTSKPREASKTARISTILRNPLRANPDRLYKLIREGKITFSSPVGEKKIPLYKYLLKEKSGQQDVQRRELLNFFLCEQGDGVRGSLPHNQHEQILYSLIQQALKHSELEDALCCFLDRNSPKLSSECREKLLFLASDFHSAKVVTKLIAVAVNHSIKVDGGDYRPAKFDIVTISGTSELMRLGPKTPLMIALEKQNDDAALVFIKHGAETAKRDGKGRTPLAYYYKHHPSNFTSIPELESLLSKGLSEKELKSLKLEHLDWKDEKKVRHVITNPMLASITLKCGYLSVKDVAKNLSRLPTQEQINWLPFLDTDDMYSAAMRLLKKKIIIPRFVPFKQVYTDYESGRGYDRQTNTRYEGYQFQGIGGLPLGIVALAAAKDPDAWSRLGHKDVYSNPVESVPENILHLVIPFLKNITGCVYHRGTEVSRNAPKFLPHCTTFQNEEILAIRTGDISMHLSDLKDHAATLEELAYLRALNPSAKKSSTVDIASQAAKISKTMSELKNRIPEALGKLNEYAIGKAYIKRTNRERAAIMKTINGLSKNKRAKSNSIS